MNSQMWNELAARLRQAQGEYEKASDTAFTMLESWRMAGMAEMAEQTLKFMEELVARESADVE